jgi:hypothetical protein
LRDLWERYGDQVKLFELDVTDELSAALRLRRQCRGVTSSDAANACGSDTSAFFKSAGTSCTTSLEIPRRLFRDLGMSNMLPEAPHDYDPDKVFVEGRLYKVRSDVQGKKEYRSRIRMNAFAEIRRYHSLTWEMVGFE